MKDIQFPKEGLQINLDEKMGVEVCIDSANGIITLFPIPMDKEVNLNGQDYQSLDVDTLSEVLRTNKENMVHVTHAE